MRVLSLFFPRLGIQLIRAARPELAGRPLGLVAGEGDSALLAAVSVEATADGVEPGMTLLQARQRCPAMALERDNARECLEQLEAVASILKTRATTNVAIVSRNSMAVALEGMGRQFADEGGAAQALLALARGWSGRDIRAGVASTLEQAECAARKARRFPLIEPDAGISELKLPRYEPVAAEFAWETPAPREAVTARLTRILGTMQPLLEAHCQGYRSVRLEIARGAYRSAVVARAEQPIHRASEVVELLRSRLDGLELGGVTSIRVSLEQPGPATLVEPWRAAVATVHQLTAPAVPVQRRLLRAS